MNPKILKYASYLISFLFMSMSIWEAVVCSKYPHPSSELNQIVYSYLVTASSMNMIMFFIHKNDSCSCISIIHSLSFQSFEPLELLNNSSMQLVTYVSELAWVIQIQKFGRYTRYKSIA